ncbi:MAG: hypothetical protein ABW054_12390 [Casimicrobiaceae bacterium]
MNPQRVTRGVLLVLALASPSMAAVAQVLASTCTAHAAVATAATQPPLANGKRQSCIELRAAAVYSSPAVQQAIERLRKSLSADTRVVAAQQQDRAARAAQEIAFGEIERLINDDRANPFAYWFYKPQHRLDEVFVPGGKYAASNPDTVFRVISMDPNGRYELRGQFLSTTRPSYFSLHLMGARNPSGKERDAGVFFDTQIVTDAAGRFSIAIDSAASSAGPNHLRLLPDSTGVLVRDTLEDWATELPVALTVTRTDAVASRTKSAEQLIEEVVANIDRAAHTVPAFRDDLFFASPVNMLPPPAAHISGNWALATSGNFALERGEALVFTLDPGAARYLGVQSGDILTGTIEPERRTSTLNNRQVHHNPDGTITYVLAPTDPGVGNWIDTGGVARGIVMIRWQGLPQQTPEQWRGVRGSTVVRIDQLPALLKQQGIVLPLSAVQDRYSLYMRRYSGW